MIEKTRFLVERVNYGGRIDIRFCKEQPNGATFVAQAVTYTEVDPTSFEGIGQEAPIRLRPDEAQELMDELWRAGIRPSEGQQCREPGCHRTPPGRHEDHRLSRTADRKTMTPLYIFDLDGTLALIEHRRHLVEPRACDGCDGECRMPLVSGACPVCKGTGRAKPDWPAFFAACVHDEPNWPVISTMNALLKSGADIRIWSGRSAEVMNETLTWLHRFFETDAEEVGLCMRVEGDFTPDEQLKAGWLDALNEYDRRRLVAVFDDRSKVVQMWRSRGVACFQVAPGDF